ncbi:MAG: hypothetical protein H6727_09165 [Myxococcales bacterium]|nr:hypothetical protein [Myxococcales bacterium]
MECRSVRGWKRVALLGALLLWLAGSACIIRPNIDPTCSERGDLEVGWLFDGYAVCPSEEGHAVKEVRVRMWRQSEDGTREALHTDPNGDVYECAKQAVVLGNSLCGVYAIQVSAYEETGRLAWNSVESVHRIVGGQLNSVRVNMRIAF